MKQCEVLGCGRKYESIGMCKSHAQRARANLPIYCHCGTVVPLVRGSHLNECLECKTAKKCSIIGCVNSVFQKEYCQMHYARWYRGTLRIPKCDKCGEPTGKETHHAKYCDTCRANQLKESSLHNERHRRAIKLGLDTEKFTRQQVWQEDDGVCYLCLAPVEFDKMHLDHIIPLTRPSSSGKMVNVAITHQRCNQKKNNRLPEECIDIFPNQRLPERFLGWKQL